VGLGKSDDLPAMSLLGVLWDQLAVVRALHDDTVAVEGIRHDGEVLNEDNVGVVEGQPFFGLVRAAVM
jgi:hypothetical protein